MTSSFRNLAFTALASCLVATGAQAQVVKQLVVPRGLCPQAILELARWSVTEPEYTAYAVPTARQARKCGEPGPAVTVGIASGPDLGDVRRAALDVCNAERGVMGRCVVVGYVRLKR